MPEIYILFYSFCNLSYYSPRVLYLIDNAFLILSTTAIIISH